MQRASLLFDVHRLTFFLTSHHLFLLLDEKVKPECRDDFLRAMKNNVYGTLTKEPNSLQFELGEDIDEPNVFYIHEEYKSIDDHRSFHRTMQHYKDCIELFNDESNNPFLVPNKVDEFYLSHDGPSSKILPTTKEGEDTPPTTKRLCLNAQLNIKPEVRDEFLQVIENLKVGGDTIEEKCLQFTWGESLEIPNQFHVHEQYIGEADGLQGYEEHLQTPHVAARDEFTATKKPFTKPPIIEKYYSIV